MNKEDYISELDRIKATSQLKDQIKKCAEEHKNGSMVKAKSRYRPGRNKFILHSIVATAACLLLVVSLFSAIPNWRVGSKPFSAPAPPDLTVLLRDKHFSVATGKIIYDFTGFAEGYPARIRVSDEYSLVNKSGIENNLQVAYPLITSFDALADVSPQLLVDGENLEYKLYAAGLPWYRHEDYEDYISSVDSDGIMAYVMTEDIALAWGDNVTVYTFTDFSDTSSYSRSASFALEFKIDVEKTRLLSFKLESFQIDDAGNVKVGGSLNYHEAEGGMLIVLGEPLDDYTLKCYTHGGFEEEHEGFSGKVHALTRSLREIVGESLTLNDDYPWQRDDSAKPSDIVNAVFSILDQRLVEVFVSLEDMIMNTIGENRLFYLVADIPFQAGQTRQLQAEYIYPLSYNHCGTGETDIYGYQLATKIGDFPSRDSIEVTIKLPDGVVISDETFGFVQISDNEYYAKVITIQDYHHFVLSLEDE